MPVVWTNRSLAHLLAIHDYIAQDSPLHAKRMVDRLTARSKRLEKFPESGQVVPEYANPAVREVIEGQYRIIYRVEVGRVAILAVIHGARPLPPTMPSDEM